MSENGIGRGRSITGGRGAQLLAALEASRRWLKNYIFPYVLLNIDY